MMGPIIADLQKLYAGKMSVEVYNVHEYPDTGMRYQPRQLPSQVFLDARGDEVFRHEGFSTKEDLITKFNEVGVR
jgi:thioredoxin 1